VPHQVPVRLQHLDAGSGAHLDHPGLQAAIGGCPSVFACYRFTVKLRKDGPLLADCLDRIATSLRAEFPDLGTDVTIDGSNLEALANGHRLVLKHGPERLRYSDPDASWGHRSAISTRGAGSSYGHKLMLACCARTGLPLAWRVETARRNESLSSLRSSTRSTLAATARDCRR
jgi:hypothetical protein